MSAVSQEPPAPCLGFKERLRRWLLSGISHTGASTAHFPSVSSLRRAHLQPLGLGHAAPRLSHFFANAHTAHHQSHALHIHTCSHLASVMSGPYPVALSNMLRIKRTVARPTLSAICAQVSHMFGVRQEQEGKIPARPHPQGPAGGACSPCLELISQRKYPQLGAQCKLSRRASSCAPALL